MERFDNPSVIHYRPKLFVVEKYTFFKKKLWGMVYFTRGGKHFMCANSSTISKKKSYHPINQLLSSCRLTQPKFVILKIFSQFNAILTTIKPVGKTSQETRPPKVKVWNSPKYLQYCTAVQLCTGISDDQMSGPWS